MNEDNASRDKSSDKPQVSGASQQRDTETSQHEDHFMRSGVDTEKYDPASPLLREMGVDLPEHESTKPITWSASEFIAHQKSFLWYISLGAIAIIFAALIFLLTSDKITTAVILIAAIFLGIMAARKPRTIAYRLDTKGLLVSTKLYPYSEFRSFAIVNEGAFSSIIFMPLKRFMPLLTVYYEPKDEYKIVGMLADRLPMETYKFDMVEQLLHRIRF